MPRFVKALLLIFFSATSLCAQGNQPAQAAQGKSADFDRVAIQALLQRIQELEARDKARETHDKDLEARIVELEAKLSGASGSTSAAPGAAPSATSSPVQAAAEAQSLPAQTGEQRTGIAGIQLHGFGFLGWQGTDLRGTKGSFGLGDLDLLLTSHVGSKTNVLSEILFEPLEGGQFKVDVERFLLQYRHDDYFTIAFGRYHTGIGFYNNYFHHGNYVQTTTDRPFLFLFADDGGILPTASVGVTTQGRIPSGPLGLHYLFEAGSGDNARTRLDGIEIDEKNGNSVNVGLIARPDAFPGLQAGFSFYHDNIHPDGFPKIDQNILAAHFVLQRPSFELLTEALLIQHKPAGTPTTLNIAGFYTQLSRRWREFRPYFRYQYVNAPEVGFLFNDVGRQNGPSFGLRYDVGESVAFKLQYDRTERKKLDSVNRIGAQVTYTF